MSVLVKYDAALFASFEDLMIREGKPQCIAHIKDVNRRRCISTSNTNAVTLEQLETSILHAESLDCTQIKQFTRDYVISRLCPTHRHILRNSALVVEVARRWRRDLKDSRRAVEEASEALRSSTDVSGVLTSIENGANKRYSLRKRRTTYERQSTCHADNVVQADRLTFDPRYKPTTRTTGKLFQTNLEHGVSGSGCLYIFTRASDPDFLKIGHGKNIEGRRARWERCYGELIVSHHIENVPHAWRAESLIHIDPRLKQYKKVEISCVSKGCGSRHIEWFKVKLDDAKTVVNEWASLLIEEKPYAADGRLRDVWAAAVQSVGDVKPDELRTIFRRQSTGTVNRTEHIHNPIEAHEISYPTLPLLEDTNTDHVQISNHLTSQSNEAVGLEARRETPSSGSSISSVSRQQTSTQVIVDITDAQMSGNGHESSVLPIDLHKLSLYVYTWLTKDMQWTGRVLLIFFSIEATAQGVSFMHRLVLAISLILLSSWCTCVKV